MVLFIKGLNSSEVLLSVNLDNFAIMLKMASFEEGFVVVFGSIKALDDDSGNVSEELPAKVDPEQVETFWETFKLCFKNEHVKIPTIMATTSKTSFNSCVIAFIYCKKK